MTALASVESVRFALQTDEQRLAQSRARVQSADLFSGTTPVVGGLYDPRMGTTDMRYNCATCGRTRVDCPGHFGHIELPFPLVLPLGVDEVRRWLRVLCFRCGRLVVDLGSERLRRAAAGRRLALAATAQVAACPHCGAPHHKVVKDPGNSFSFNREVATDKRVEMVAVQPYQIARLFDRVSDDTVRVMGRDPAVAHPRRLVLKRVLAVPPVSIRPAVRMSGAGGHGSSVHDSTGLLQYVVSLNSRLEAAGPVALPARGAAPSAELAENIESLQQLVYDLLQGSNVAAAGRAGDRRGMVMGGRPVEALAQRLAKKKGILRRNLLGARVWAIGRNTISGQSRLAAHELGMPEFFAQMLQVVETVTAANLAELTRFFLNGRREYPGASRVWRAATGNFHDVEGLRASARLEVGDRLYRDVVTGDVAMFNRQPSLERSAMNVHRIVVLGGKAAGGLPAPPIPRTLAMNVLTTPLYNADFDGDEMNIKVLAQPGVRAEGLELAGVAHAFISTKSSGPVVGMVQDSTVGSFLLSRAAGLSKLEAMGLFAQAVAGAENFDPPDFGDVAPDARLSGREALGFLLGRYPVSLERKPEWFSSAAEPYIRFAPDEVFTRIERGVLVSGVLDKATVGASAQGGLFHRIARAYGADEALRSVFALQQATVAFLDRRGFSTSIDDMQLPPANAAQVREIVGAMMREADLVTERLVAGEMIPPLGMTTREFYERQQIEAMKVPDTVLGAVLSCVNTDTNSMVQMVNTGSKGNSKNIINIMAVVGPTIINGSLIMPGESGRTLAYYQRGEMTPASRGFVAGNYVAGLTAAEHTFGAKNGRNDLTAKALATASTGYANRKAIMSLQSAVADALRAVVAVGLVQQLYGEDGLDARQVEAVKYAPALMSNAELRARYAVPALAGLPWHDAEVARLKADRDEYRAVVVRIAEGNFGFTVTGKVLLAVDVGVVVRDAMTAGAALRPEPSPAGLEAMHALVAAFCDDLPFLLLNDACRRTRAAPDYMRQAVAHLARSARAELCSAALAALRATPVLLLAVFDTVRLRYLRSLVAPGEAVGVLAAQAVSEPLTQYMLDSHHRSVSGGTSKAGITRPQEIMGARKVEREGSSEMVLRGVVPRAAVEGGAEVLEPTNDRALLQELADALKMLTLNQLLVQWKVLFERMPSRAELLAGPGPSEEFLPEFVRDWRWMLEALDVDPLLEKTIGESAGLTPWCGRFVVDRLQLVMKSISLETVVTRLRQAAPGALVLHSPEEDVDEGAPIVVRVYLATEAFKASDKKRAEGDKKRSNEEEAAMAEFRALREFPLRGVKGILDAHVEQVMTHRVVPDTNFDGSPNPKAGGLTSEKETYVIRTTGTNLHGVALHTRVDMGSIVSSSIGDTIKMFGIEAGRARMIHEIRRVMGSKSPTARHLMMYADMMTMTGVHTPFEESGIAQREACNVMLRASMHGPVQVLTEATLRGAENPMIGLASPMLMGGMPKVGTATVKLIVDREFVASHHRSVKREVEDL